MSPFEDTSVLWNASVQHQTLQNNSFCHATLQTAGSRRLYIGLLSERTSSKKGRPQPQTPHPCGIFSFYPLYPGNSVGKEFSYVHLSSSVSQILAVSDAPRSPECVWNSCVSLDGLQHFVCVKHLILWQEGGGFSG